ncbi:MULTISPECIES: LuxR C-terminal-related transcriptional regulator [Polaribacter]|uniref:LuxR C-terminal-related transcriptional regulator n=1 Tax=Polaribacter sejongensis TaxID=985043 RepID=A0AAJ1QYG6_9FLAO|nr:MULTISPECIES: LuxR C-terminal-related transcriptional regulator [Polaribacter]MDN3620253.1 LuxR C-terminal-related transcriptional regulator [Polaribacter undariae]UWD32654.1 LuxR C-terminal-related transcriptional regulator [Polaribacter undariae]
MKIKLLLIFLFIIGFKTFAQSGVYYFKDTNSSFSYKNINKAEFKPLKKEVLEKHSSATFWFKIPAKTTALDYLFRIKNIRAINVHAYQNFNEISKLNNERYVSFMFSREDPVFIKANSNFSSYFPVVLSTVGEGSFKEKLQLSINGFYYGVAFLVILFSINYYYFFKDSSFFYHAFLLTTITFIFVIFDGFLNFFNVDQKKIELLILLDYILLSYASLKFGNSFLLLDKYFPKVKKYTFALFLIIVLLVISFFILRVNQLYIILSVFTLLLLFIYWFLGVLLFNKNNYTKLFVFSYAISLFSGLDFFVLKNFGVSLLETNATNLKIGGFVQIIVLSFAVLFWEKDLRKYNFFMKNEIRKFSKEIKHRTIQEEALKVDLNNLSLREREIFDLIVCSKSNKEIAAEINISVNTVKFHVKNIYLKLDIKNRKEALTLKKS